MCITRDKGAFYNATSSTFPRRGFVRSDDARVRHVIAISTGGAWQICLYYLYMHMRIRMSMCMCERVGVCECMCSRRVLHVSLRDEANCLRQNAPRYALFFYINLRIKNWREKLILNDHNQRDFKKIVKKNEKSSWNWQQSSIHFNGILLVIIAEVHQFSSHW